MALLFATFVIHRDALKSGWRSDDLEHLMPAWNSSFAQMLFIPSNWHEFSRYFFTPILAAQYKLDLLLFGFNPRSFMIHNLVDLAVTVIFTYILLSRRCPRSLSFIACIGFLLTMPTFSIATFIYSRHYIAGLFFAIASIHVHRNAYIGNMTRNLLISAILYFLALMSKEIYATILMYFLLASWRSPAFTKSLLIYPPVLAIFIAWRNFMSGGGL